MMDGESIDQVQRIVEGALMAANKPLTLEQLQSLFDEQQRPTRTVLEHVISRIEHGCEGRGFELKKVASGWRFQVCESLSPWVSRLWDEKPQRYSRALLETVALIAYRQPVTRGEIEEVRGVTVNTNIIRTLLDREWIRVVGQRDVPGRPSMYATTKQFLDYFNLRSLEELPSLAEVRDLETISREVEDRLQEELALDESTSNTHDNTETNE